MAVGDTGTPTAPWAQALEEPRAALDPALHWSPGKGWAALLAKSLFIGIGSVTKNMAREIHYLASAPRVSGGISYFQLRVTNTADPTVKHH